MSDILNDSAHCELEDCTSNAAIRNIIVPKDKDLGGFSVRRLMPSDTLKAVGPFIFFDHLGPAHFKPGTGIDVRPHPHIGLATITYLFEGEILHRDNLGNVQPIRPGAINWMTAGRGIAHSERTPPTLRSAGHDLHALQLWVALPQEHEETEPNFTHYDADQMPVLDEGEVFLRVMIGEAFELVSPVKTYSPTLYLEVQMKSGASLTLPDGYEERAIYVVSGEVQVGSTPVAQHHMAVLDAAPGLVVSATQDTRLVVIGGRSLGKRTVWWNLVASRKDLIERAKDDWKNDRFEKIPGETEFIPLPE